MYEPTADPAGGAAAALPVVAPIAVTASAAMAPAARVLRICTVVVSSLRSCPAPAGQVRVAKSDLKITSSDCAGPAQKLSRPGRASVVPVPAVRARATAGGGGTLGERAGQAAEETGTGV